MTAVLRVAILCLLFVATSASAQSAGATLKLPSILGDHMVLQAGKPAPIWGWGKPGQTVTVRFSGQTRKVKVGADGRWTATLAPLPASSNPADLTVTSDVTVVVTDVLVGEVWLASGQSNMEKPLGLQPGQQPTLNYEQEIAAADYPDMRLFKVERARAPTPDSDVKGRWVKTTPATIDAIKFSAAAYFFGRKIHRELGVPVGMIESSLGGTRIEPWTPREAYEAAPSLVRFAEARRTSPLKLPDLQVASLYYGMVAPLAPYAMRGVIWYQGESNVIDYNGDAVYADNMTALVEGWRAAFGQDLSFYYVQIANYLYHVVRPDTVVSPEAEPLLWEAQAAAMRIPRTGMVVTTDLGNDMMDNHPRNKKDVGERLARWALAKDYGRSEIVVSGPLFRSMTVRDGQAILSFDHVADGLATRDGKPPTWFVVAGADGKFHRASAVIDGDRVVVSSPIVPAPKVVRFGWDEGARPNLMNSAGLPAAPFRTDSPFAPVKP